MLLHDSLLNDMTIITKVEGPTLITWMMTYWKSTAFPRGCYQALSSPFLRREPGDEVTQYLGNTIYQQSPLPLQSPISAHGNCSDCSLTLEALPPCMAAMYQGNTIDTPFSWQFRYLNTCSCTQFYCLYSRSICGCWRHSHHICINSQCFCSHMLLLYKQ